MPDTNQVAPDKEQKVSAQETKPVAKSKEIFAKEVPTKKRPVRKFFKFFVDVKRWSSYDEVSSNAKGVWGLFRRLTKRNKDVRHETYEEAIARMRLNEQELVERKKVFLRSAFIYATFSLGFTIYLLYLLVNLRLVASGLMALVVVLMSLSAYREHFWYMQMQKKKLGCNFHDWLAFILRGPTK